MRLHGSLETIKLKALLHIQKFIEDSGDGYGGMGLPEGGNWKPVPDSGSGAKVFIQTSSKMNERNYNDEEETPF